MSIYENNMKYNNELKTSVLDFSSFTHLTSFGSYIIKWIFNEILYKSDK